jgi:hypothetical protein
MALPARLGETDAVAGARRAVAHDFFFELMRDSQRVRAVYLAERERWVRGLPISGREEILFELEMLLRGIDRFFNLRNLFGDAPPSQDRDWREELKSARDAVHRASHLSRRLIAEPQEQALLFRSFVEGSLADDRARSRLGAELREQRTPEESLFLLRTGLVSHQNILDHLLNLDAAPQPLFVDVGRVLQHELFASRYFCPPTPLEFRAEYDRVGSVRLLEALRGQRNDKKRKAFAVALLASFRSLRSLRYVPAPPAPHSRRVLVILALVWSEVQALIGYLDNDLPALVGADAAEATAAGRDAAAAIRSVLEGVPALLEVPLTERGQLDRQRDKLVDATKEGVGAIARGLDPALGTRALFEDETVRLEQSERLRRDLWVFRELCRETARMLEAPSADPEQAEPLRAYAIDFRDVGYQLLRHSDRELFDRFLDLLEGWWGHSGESTAARIQRLRNDCRRFGEILDRALELVGKRVELQRNPIDQRAYQQALALAMQPG